MSRVCEITGKKRTFGNAVSHSKRHTRRSWLPNLVKHTFIDENGKPHKMKISARGLRTLYKKPRVRKTAVATPSQA